MVSPAVAKHHEILLVDDEQPILDLLCDVLEDAGYTVHTARNGRMALDVLEQTSISLVLTDLMMPYMDGYTLCAQLRTNPQTAHLPVVGMSAADSAGGRSGFTAFLAKPFDIDNVVELVEKLLSTA